MLRLAQGSLADLADLADFSGSTRDAAMTAPQRVVHPRAAMAIFIDGNFISSLSHWNSAIFCRVIAFISIATTMLTACFYFSKL